jgi:hypothetical protein
MLRERVKESCLRACIAGQASGPSRSGWEHCLTLCPVTHVGFIQGSKKLLERRCRGKRPIRAVLTVCLESVVDQIPSDTVHTLRDSPRQRLSTRPIGC